MTKAQKLARRLKQDWAKTNSTNWDVVETTLKSAKKMIDSGVIDKELIDSYIIISEEFKIEFKHG